MRKLGNKFRARATEILAKFSDFHANLNLISQMTSKVEFRGDNKNSSKSEGPEAYLAVK